MDRLSLLLLVFLLVFPFRIHVSAEEPEQLDLKSESAALLDSETNAVLYEKNAEEKMYPASITKIATAIYAIEKGNLDSIATVSSNAANQEGTRVYLVEGEQVSLKKLIQGMLINSGNDAAVAIAEHVDGSVESFAEHLNDFLRRKIGVKNTHFTNPSGLHDENHYTTAMDMALITNYAIKNPVFAEIFGTKELKWQGQSWDVQLYTHHRMLKGELPYQGITGGKTGFTDQSRQTLATTADNGKLKLTAIVLKSELKDDKYKDTALLLDYGFNNYQHATLQRGELFQSGQQKYYSESNTLLTEKVQGSIKKVSSNGTLSIEDNQGRLIQKVQLKNKALEQKPQAAVEKSAPLQQKNVHQNNYVALYGILLLAAAAAVVGAGKRFSRKF